MSEDNLSDPETRDTHILQYDGASSERMGDKTPDMQSKEGSDAPELANKSVDGAMEDILREPEKADRPNFQHDGAFSEQASEKTVDVQVVEGSDDSEFEKRLLDQLSEYIKGNPETNNTLCFHEDGTGEADAMEPRIHSRENSIENARFEQATQRTVATQQYWDFLDQISETPLRIQVPDETSALEPYVDILRRCPFSGKSELTTVNGIFAAPEPMAQTNWQAKQSLPNLQSRYGTERESVLAVPPPQDFGHLNLTGLHEQQYSAELGIEDDFELERPPTHDFRPSNLTGDHQQQGSRELGIEEDFALEAPPILEYRPLNLAGAHNQQRSAELGLEGNFALEGPPTQGIGVPNFEAPLLYQRPSELETEGNLALEGLLTKDFGSWNLTGAHQQERPLELGMESNFVLEGLALEQPPRQASMQSELASTRQHQHSSDRAMEGDARSNGGWSNNLGPERLPGAWQLQQSNSWNMCPQRADTYSQNMTPFHFPDTRQQQCSVEVSREGNLQWEHPPPQEFRPLYPPRVSQQQPWLDIGGKSILQWDTPLSRESWNPRPAVGPPVQAFPPPRSWSHPRQEGNTKDIGAPVQPQVQPKAPPLFSYPWFKLRDESRQRGNLIDMSRQIQTPLTARSTKSIPAPMRQQGQHQGI